ncbi:hypothetical protein [Owenweeksia hongkongensis]|uniref:hypothetical protein n=1 Tax=Owenweeksia hongkongensis TaxID=253245 RepID=UPI003A92840D
MFKRVLLIVGSFALIVSLIFNIGAFGIIKKNLEQNHRRLFNASHKLSYFEQDAEKTSQSIAELVDSTDYRYSIFLELIDSTFERLYQQQLEIIEYSGGYAEETGTLAHPESISYVKGYFRNKHRTRYQQDAAGYFDNTINNYLQSFDYLFPNVESNLAKSYSWFRYHRHDNRSEIFYNLTAIESLILLSSMKENIIEDQLLILPEVSY